MVSSYVYMLERTRLLLQRQCTLSSESMTNSIDDVMIESKQWEGDTLENHAFHVQTPNILCWAQTNTIEELMVYCDLKFQMAYGILM